MKPSIDAHPTTAGLSCPRHHLRRGGLLRVVGPALLACAWILTGCGAGSIAAGSGAETPVPTPTRDPSGYQAIHMQACAVADWAAMQTNRAQGDLISWRPLQSSAGSPQTTAGAIAYVAPAERTSWFTGELMLALGPTYKEHLRLAPGIHTSGSLTWSPSGSRLAFIAFRSNENLYTVMVVNADGSQLVDLFPNDLAHTDSRTSEKAILGWESENELEVLSSCGEECRQSYRVTVAPGAAANLDGAAGETATQAGAISDPTPVADYHTLSQNLQVHTRAHEYNEDDFPKGIYALSWSPDDRMIDFLDKRGFLWLLTLANKTMYPLDIGLRDIEETRWSSDSASLGVRAEDRIFIYEVPCRSQ